MLLTTNDRLWHAEYEGLDPSSRVAIDIAFHATQAALEAEGFDILPLDDRAEALIAAITRYATGN